MTPGIGRPPSMRSKVHRVTVSLAGSLLKLGLGAEKTSAVSLPTEITQCNGKHRSASNNFGRRITTE